MREVGLAAESVGQALREEVSRLDAAENSPAAMESYWVWQPENVAVVGGRGTQWDQEVDREECSRRDIPIVTRPSGGATVLVGPGCVMYGIILSRERHESQSIAAAHRWVLGSLAEALRPLKPTIVHAGTSDLAVSQNGVLLKVAGNSLRVKKRHLLYHGTLLNTMDLSLLDACLKHPPREPDYRGRRRHTEFVTNLNLDFHTLGEAVRKALGRAIGEGSS